MSSVHTDVIIIEVLVLARLTVIVGVLCSSLDAQKISGDDVVRL